MQTGKITVLLLGLLLLTAFNLQAGISASGAAAGAPVGTVTLRIGDVVAIDADAQSRSLQRGDSIFAGDTIETAAGGHVHLRFIDDANVSVRPSSRLQIELYRYDPQNPANNAIRFNLEKGVLRSISGKAADAAHDRYRLNTPIAALGVLGTDYVIRATGDGLWAAVYSGGIAVAPLGEGCSKTGLGVCRGATELMAEMGEMMLEMHFGDAPPRLRPGQLELSPEPLASSSQPSTPRPMPAQQPVSRVPGSEADDAPLHLPEAVGMPAVGPLSESAGLGLVDSDVFLSKVQSPVHPDELVGVDNEGIVRDLDQDIISLTPLAWGRWPWSPVLSNDQWTQTFLEAAGGRHLVVSNFDYGLFRADSQYQTLKPESGRYNFRLNASQAVFTDHLSRVSEVATVDDASLVIDFQSRAFETRIDVSSATAGQAGLELAGQISDNGIFHQSGNGGSVNGALTLDGRHAGMLFEQVFNGGKFSGLTDWSH